MRRDFSSIFSSNEANKEQLGLSRTIIRGSGSTQILESFNWMPIRLSHAAILGGISVEVCEINPHNSDLLQFFGQIMVNLLCKWLVYFEKLLFTLF
jgi:hypothetical protein